MFYKKLFPSIKYLLCFESKKIWRTLKNFEEFSHSETDIIAMKWTLVLQQIEMKLIWTKYFKQLETKFYEMS